MSAQFSRRLSPHDAAFLYWERDTAPLNIGSVAIFEGCIPFEKFVTSLDSRMHLIPRYRQRVVPAPFNLAHPTWEYDPQFDIRRHVRRVTVPPPGDDDQLARLAADLFAPPLDRGKPLWEIFFIEGLSGQRTALVSKVHHCLVDGVSGIALLTVTLDVVPDPPPTPPPDKPYDPGPLPSPSQLLADALWDRLTEGVRTFGEVQLRLLDPELGQRLWRFNRALETAAPLLLRPVAKMPFNRPLTGQRRIAWVEMPFAEIRAIRSCLGGTVNDVVLAVVAGALGRYLALHGQNTDGLELNTMVPVNVRREDEPGTLGNRISVMLVALPVGIKDPIARLNTIRERMDLLKRVDQAGAVERLLELISWAAPPLIALAGGLPQRNTALHLNCTNVPGPMIPLYTVGHRMVAHYPLIPLSWDLGLGVGVTSYNQRLYFALMVDPNAVPDVERLREFLEESFQELRLAAGVPLTDLPIVIGRAMSEAVASGLVSEGGAPEAPPGVA